LRKEDPLTDPTNRQGTAARQSASSHDGGTPPEAPGLSDAPSSAENQERAAGVTGFFKLEVRVFLAVVVVAIVFLGAIILFSVTR